MSKSATIDHPIQELEKSPLFALSLCGKELAHSNFWEWLIKLEDNKKHPFIEVLQGFYKNNYVFTGVKREENHRDITIHYKDGNVEKCFVIENKLKSIPTIEQLTSRLFQLIILLI